MNESGEIWINVSLKIMVKDEKWLMQWNDWVSGKTYQTGLYDSLLSTKC